MIKHKEGIMKEKVLITGASRGLGFRIAEKFAEMGHSLILVARNENALKKSRETIIGRMPGCEVDIYAADLSKREDIHGLIAWIAKEQKVVKGLINNAGIYPYKPFLDGEWDEIALTVDLNLTGVMLLTHGIIRGMLTHGGGRIINIASDVAKRPIANMAPYVASKAGLLAFSRSISKEFRSRHVYVSVVEPGLINNNENEEPDIDLGMLSNRRIADVVGFVFENSDRINFDEVEIHPLMQDY